MPELHVYSFFVSSPTGFSGCHRYEAHQQLGLPTIRCKIRRGTKETLRFMFHFLYDYIFLMLSYIPINMSSPSTINVQASPSLSQRVVLY